MQRHRQAHPRHLRAVRARSVLNAGGRLVYSWLILTLLLSCAAPLHAQTPTAPLAPGPSPAPVQMTAPAKAGTPAAPAVPAGQPTAPAPDPELEAAVDALLARMSPADRVGQLFVVNFKGNEVNFESDIVELIHGYRVGGVVLSPANGNFSNEKGVDTPRQASSLINQLQAVAYGLLVPAEKALDPMPFAPWPPRDFTFLPQLTNVPPSNIPLFVAVEQAGDDLPGTALRRGFTPLPSQMAMGATWDPALVEQVGDVVGRELHAVGVNLLLGPSLDVYDQPNVEKAGSLGAYSFGGDPFWVSELGRAYIAGVHAGGGGQVATVAGHFPGQGNADRQPDEEVATIQKSQDEMRRIALPPFLRVTRQPSSVIDPTGDAGATDVLMTSHMRFSGLQGGAAGRITPLSLAPELRTILEQEGLGDWHDRGGVVMSNSLGSPAIRRFYGDQVQDFYNRRVALDAFTAGNDLLYLGNFSADGNWPSEMANIKGTIGFFQDRYNNDPDFATRVDAAVRRILRLKLGLYRKSIHTDTASAGQEGGDAAHPLVPLASVMVNENSLGTLGGEARSAGEGVMSKVARSGATILYPDPSTQTEQLPPAFRPDDHILIVSDSRLVRECATCPAEAAIGPDELANIIKSLYGSEATGQINAANVTSLTFADLAMFLDSRLAAVESPGAPVTATLGISTAAGATVTPAVTPAVNLSILPTAAPLTATAAVSGSALLSPALTAVPAATATLPADSGEAAPGGTEAGQGQERKEKTQALIQNADWIIFTMLDVDPAHFPNSDIVRRFLREYSDKLTDQRLVTFALNAPYFLDATEMSKLTTYFGVYSKTQPFLESAARALFHSFTPTGAPPVAAPGTRFSNLADRLAPDPARMLPLAVGVGDKIISKNSGDSAAVRPSVQAGATLRISVGPVLDRNGHAVADGTPVSLQIQYDGEELALAVDPAITRGGTATRDVVVDRGGVLRVAATTGGATTGSPLAVAVEAIPTPASAGGPGAGATAGSAGSDTPSRSTLGSILSLLLALFTILATLSLFLIVQVRILPRTVLVHNMLWAAIFGLLGYIVYAVGWFPGGTWLYQNVRVWGTPLVVFVPMLVALLWLQLRSETH